MEVAGNNTFEEEEEEVEVTENYLEEESDVISLTWLSEDHEIEEIIEDEIIVEDEIIIDTFLDVFSIKEALTGYTIFP